MEQAVLISIKPEWVSLIASGEKTVEIRKTQPSIETPFKCFIYETAAGRGKVVGEFICDKIDLIPCTVSGCVAQTYKSCIDLYDMLHYLNGRAGYAWHISGLKMYDTPKELNEFKRWN